MSAGGLVLGARYEYSRRISAEDIRQFTAASHDANVYHVQEDESGRLIAHGLLVASLATKLGGDLRFLARTMTFEFVKPTYSGDTLTCVATVASLIEQRGRVKCRFTLSITNQKGEVVMTGATAGMIKKPSAAC